MNSPNTEQYRSQFKSELANLIGCIPEALPASTTKEIAAQYLGLANKKTLNVWHSAGRHGIVMVKVGRITQPTTQWLIDIKMAGLSVAMEVS